MDKRELRRKVLASEKWIDRAGDVRYEISDALADELVGAGFCANCAGYGDLVHLQFQPADRDNYAADVCLECEEAYNVKTSPIYEYDGYSDAAGMCYSDADSGL